MVEIGVFTGGFGYFFLAFDRSDGRVDPLFVIRMPPLLELLFHVCLETLLLKFNFSITVLRFNL